MSCNCSTHEEFSEYIRHLETEKNTLQRLVAELLLKNQALRQALADEQTRNTPLRSGRSAPKATSI
jgi:hypothetical protein